RPQRPSYDRPRAERPRFERARPEAAPGERPRFERPRPQRPSYDRPRSDRPRSERPRFDRPRFERPRDERPAFHDDAGDQTGAVNRSRPVYPQGPNVRWRRDGTRSPRPETWAAPQAQERSRHAGPAPQAPAAGPFRGHVSDRHPAAVAPATDGPS